MLICTQDRFAYKYTTFDYKRTLSNQWQTTSQTGLISFSSLLPLSCVSVSNIFVYRYITFCVYSLENILFLNL